jgi:hypothetical protein
MSRLTIATLTALLLATGCGEDKDYGAPLDNPTAQAHATQAVTNVALLDSNTTNDTPLSAIDALSANFNLITGAKYQDRQGTAQYAPGAALVDETCVVITETSFTYTDCEFAGNTVNGTVSRSGDTVSVDVHFSRSDTDTTTTIDVDGSVTANAQKITGYVDFDIDINTDNGTIHTSLDGNFDVVLADGCAVDGQLECHAVAKAAGQSQSVWAKAEFGPECGQVTIY